MFNPNIANPFMKLIPGVTDPQAQVGQAVGDAAGGALGAAVHGVLGAISAPGNIVRSNIGAGAQDVAALLGHPDALPADSQEAFDTAMRAGQVAAGNAPGTFNIGALPAPFSKFLTASLFDPVNYVGMGIPGKALQASKLARAGLKAEDLASAAEGLGKTPTELLSQLAPEAGPKAHVLEMLDAFEGKTQHALHSLFELPGEAAAKIGEQIPLKRDIIHSINPDGSANIGPSENLTDWAGALSRRGYLKQFSGNLAEAISQYKAMGGDPLNIDPSGLPTRLADQMTPQVQASFAQHIDALGGKRRSIDNIFENLYRGRLQTEVPAGLNSQLPGAIPDQLDRHTAILDALGIPHGDITNAKDLLDAIHTHVPDQDFAKLDSAIKSYPTMDFMRANPLDLVHDRVVRDRAKTLGLDAPSGLQSALGTGTALFSEQALQSVAYLWNNMFSGLGMGALEGVNPFKVARDLASNAADAGAGKPIYTSGTKNLATAIGLTGEDGLPLLPHTIDASAAGMLDQANPISDYTGRGLSASQKIGAPKLALAGGGLGAASGIVSSPSDATPQEKLTNAAIGAGLGAGALGSMPTLSKYLLQRYSRGIEDVMRQGAWEHGTREALMNSSDQVEQIVRDAFDKGFKQPPVQPVDIKNTPTGKLVDLLRAQGVEPPRTWVGGPFQPGDPMAGTAPDWQLMEQIKNGTFPPLNQKAHIDWHDALQNLANPQQLPDRTPNMPVDDYVQLLHSIQGHFSPETLADSLVNHIGMNPHVAADAGRQWKDVVDAASQQGADLSNTIHFDYSNLNNLQDAVKQFVPFSTWSMKAFPFFEKHIAEHPVILQSMEELKRQSEEMRKETGLTQKVDGTMPLGSPMDALWSMALGRPVQTFGNPLRSIVPNGDALKTLQDATPEDASNNPLADIYKMATAFGPSLNPALELMLRTTGLLGKDTPARGSLRLAGPLQGLSAMLGANRGAGINLDQAPMDAEGKIREALSGQKVTDLAKTATERRIDELAYKNTGMTINSGNPAVAPYLQAKLNSSGPIWDQANKDSQQERGLRSLVGYVSTSLAPQATVSQEESQIRGARAELLVPQDVSTKVRALNDQNPTAPVPADLLTHVADIIHQIPPDSGINPVDIKAVVDQPTAANVDWLFRAIYEYQSKENPAVSGYSGAGTPEARQLQTELAARRNTGITNPGMSPGAIALAQMYRQIPTGMRPSGTVAGKLNTELSGGVDSFTNANPQLAQYLAYLKANQGQGSVQSFLGQ